MTRRPDSRTRVRARRGLTLLETLAAIILLASIAVACAGLLREVRRDAERSSRRSHGGVDGAAELIADAVLRDPGRFGLDRLSELTTNPRNLAPDAAMLELFARVQPDHREPDRSITAPLPTVTAWILPGATSHPHSPSPSEQAHTPTRTPPVWLVLQVDDRVALRLLPSGPESRP